jgi:hypothetical protein
LKIECYLSLGCASDSALRGNIKKALELEHLKADVTFFRIKDKEAQALGLKGSPSVIINDKDIEPQDMPGFS